MDTGFKLSVMKETYLNAFKISYNDILSGGFAIVDPRQKTWWSFLCVGVYFTQRSGVKTRINIRNHYSEETGC